MGPWQARPNMFTASNMIVYPDGSIGPRYGLFDLTLTGDSISNGVVGGIGYNLQADASGVRETWLVVGTAVYVLERDTGSVDSVGAIGATPAAPVQYVQAANVSYLSVPGDKTYKLTHVASSTISALTASATVFSPGMTCYGAYGDRIVAAGAGKAPDGTTSPGYRLYYSNPIGATSDPGPEGWTATNYLDVGGTAGICGLWEQRNHLVIAKTDGTWWVVTGVLGVNDVLRQVDISVSPNQQDAAYVVSGGDLAYAVGSTVDGSVGSLGLMDGSRPLLNGYLFFSEGRSPTDVQQPALCVRPLKERGDWFAQRGRQSSGTNNRMTTLCRKVWSQHAWGISEVMTGHVSSSPLANDTHLMVARGSSDAVKLYRWRAYATRPAFTSDTAGKVGDGSATPLTCSLRTPEWWAQQGEELTVRSVTVDGRKWSTGASATNHYDLTVTALRLYQGDQDTGVPDVEERTSAVQSFDQAGASSTTSGQAFRKQLSYGAQGVGNGFRLDFTNVRGLALSKIEVDVEIHPARLR